MNVENLNVFVDNSNGQLNVDIEPDGFDNDDNDDPGLDEGEWQEMLTLVRELHTAILEAGLGAGFVDQESIHQVQ